MLKFKYCGRCFQALPLTHFHNLSSSHDKKQYYCKDCMNTYVSIKRAQAIPCLKVITKKVAKPKPVKKNKKALTVDKTFKMTHWNYRIIEMNKITNKDDDNYGMFEVYWNKDKVIATDTEPTIVGFNVEDIQKQLVMLLVDAHKPALKYEDMPNWFKKSSI